MVTSSACLKKYGQPTLQKNMISWAIPNEYRLKNKVLPKKIYCNRDLTKPFEQAILNLINRDCLKELKTWDGCFNIRFKTVSKTTYSLHSWGIAIDMNAKENGYNKPVTFSQEFLQCFRDAGFDCGADFKVIKDGMHFQLSNI